MEEDDDDEDVEEDDDDDDDVDEDGFFHFPSADGITIIAAGSTIITSSFPGRVLSGRRNRMKREVKKTLIIPKSDSSGGISLVSRVVCLEKM